MTPRFAHPKLEELWHAGAYAGGCTPPWDAELVAGLAKTVDDAPTVLEVGGYLGTTTLTLAALGCDVEVVEVDPERAKAIRQLLCSVEPNAFVYCADGLEWMREHDGFEPYDAVFLDGDHTASVVAQEIEAARRIVRPGGLILVHDVLPDAVFGLATVVRDAGGFVIDTPRLHAAGGLGVIYV